MAIFLVEDQFSGINMLTESLSTGTNLFIEGPFLMTNKYNRNGRNYPKYVVEPAYDNYKSDYIDERRSIGQFKHPEYPFPEITEAAIFIKEMEWRGDDLHGKAQVLEDMGPDSDGVKIAALLKADYNLGVSSRGLGDVKKTGDNQVEVLPGFEFFAVDAVDRPSGQTCYVNALYESEMKDWIKKDGVWLINEGERKLNEKTPSKLVDERKMIKMFENFLGNLTV